jgi:subtilisin family serine protease
MPALETHWGKRLPIGTPRSLPPDGDAPGSIFGYVALQADGDGRDNWLLDERQDLTRTPRRRVDERTRQAAVEQARKDGFNVLAQSRFGLALVGPRAAWNRLCGGETSMAVAMMQRRGGRFEYVRYVGFPPQQADLPSGAPQQAAPTVAAAPFDKAGIGAIGAELVRTPLALSAVAPAIAGRHYLRVPEDVALLTGAATAHERGCKGKGVTVAMIDTGHFRHPFFKGYDVRDGVAVVPGTTGARDPVGHGTAESANIFAVAPEATLWPYRASDDAGQLVATLAALMKAKEDRPRGADGEPLPYVISCSWGAEFTGPLPRAPRGMDRAIVVELLDAIEDGIVVVFAAGNGCHSIEAQVPGVISAGGAYVDENMDAIVSDYATAYRSLWQDDTYVPTLCGLVGMRPRAAYIALPVPPGCPIDVERSAADDKGDPGDGTKPDDGWALLSGTSAAAPQVAGAAAVLLGAHPQLTPKEVSDCLTASALDIQAGTCNPRFAYEAGAATAGRDVSAGFGLVDVDKALAHARVWHECSEDRVRVAA